MDKARLLIADSNEDFRTALSQALEPYYQVTCCQDGKQALALLRREQPDVLVLDPMLPELDGISLLKATVRENIRPMVVMAARFISDYIQETAGQLGVGYLLQKPCAIHIVVARIRDLDRRLHPISPNLRVQASQILFSLNFCAKHDGFSYALDAILLMVPDTTQQITKVIYRQVAQKYGRTVGIVERSIRTAVEAAWAQRDPEIWHFYFPNHTGHPANADFIIRIAMSLEMNETDSMI